MGMVKICTNTIWKSKHVWFYYKKIDGKYGSAYQKLPGLPVQYIVATEEGIYQYTLESIKFFEPPFDLFLIPDTFQKVSIEEFIQKVSAP